MDTYKIKSLTISRKPGKDKDGFWTAFMGLFDSNNPHLEAKTPIKVLEIKNVEKVRIHDLRNVSYYLMGNDMVINDLTELSVDYKDNILTLTGKQDLKE
jgi:hypothetical protein